MEGKKDVGGFWYIYSSGMVSEWAALRSSHFGFGSPDFHTMIISGTFSGGVGFPNYRNEMTQLHLIRKFGGPHFLPGP